MLEILTGLGLSEEMAQKIIETLKTEGFYKAEEENKEEKNDEKKLETPPVGKVCDDIPSKEEFEKMGYMARLELAKTNPGLYERLKNNI